MQTRRIVEMIGSFLVGGGVVAAGYELSRSPRDVVAELGAESVAAAAEAETRTAETEADPPGGHGHDVDPDAPAWMRPDESGRITLFPPIFADEVPFDAVAEGAFPRHGLVTTLAVIVRARPDVTSPIAGILRAGTRVRTDVERTFGGGCKQGWQHVFPDGWICRDAGLTVEDQPPSDGVFSIPAPTIDNPMPYEYWRVKDEMTPFFHRLPSFEEQDRADIAGQAWFQAQPRVPMPTDPAKRPKDVPAVVKEYMNAGYWVTKAGEEVKSQRRFLRTLRGTYARKYQFHQRGATDFRGWLVDGEESLPRYFIVRELPIEVRETEGSDVLKPSEHVPQRLSEYSFSRRIYIGNKEYYEDTDGRLMRAYAVAKAYKLKRPPGIGADERWIHIDLSEQVLMAHDGDRPVFVTLVSTGKVPGMTPPGIYRIQTKHLATSMRDQPVEEEAYSIEDVPWTQYFHGSLAIHGAFWHSGFGLVRSHGCVNLSPSDARWIFGFTRPLLPPGWHSVGADTLGNGKGTAVVITE